MQKRLSYKPPFLVQAKSWSDIKRNRVNNSGGQQSDLLELVQHIKNSELSIRLSAYTSMNKHVVSSYEKIEPLSESLHIEFDIFGKV